MIPRPKVFDLRVRPRLRLEQAVSALPGSVTNAEVKVIAGRAEPLRLKRKKKKKRSSGLPAAYPMLLVDVGCLD